MVIYLSILYFFKDDTVKTAYVTMQHVRERFKTKDDSFAKCAIYLNAHDSSIIFVINQKSFAYQWLLNQQKEVSH